LIITVEVYFSKNSESIKAFIEETTPNIIINSKAWIGSNIFVWVASTVGL
jgi:hypothetical protein